MIRWPEEERALQHARESQVPRLILVEPDHQPPVMVDDLEDWIRLPATNADIANRITLLDRRSEQRQASTPHLDDDGILRFRGRWVALPRIESRLTHALLRRFGAVVSREELGRAGWPSSEPGKYSLNVHVLRLRRRLEPIGLVLRTVRSRGYLLAAAPEVPMPEIVAPEIAVPEVDGRR